MNASRASKTRPLTCLALVGAALSTAACAGPRVGEIVGAPSSTSTTVQARVVSSTPVVAQVAVPRQVCFDELRQEPARSSGGGAVLGAIAGGAMGNAVGKGTGKAVATGLGVILGAALGDHIETDGRPGVMRTVQRCEQQTTYQNQVVSYNVVYEYGGQRYSTQMQHEPGATIPVNVTVSPGYSPAPYAPQPSYPQPYAPSYSPSYAPSYPPGYQVVTPAVVSTPVYTRYVARPVAPVTQVVYSPGVVIREHDHGRHEGHHHWREERCDDERDDRGERRFHHDEGRATFQRHWN